MSVCAENDHLFWDRDVWYTLVVRADQRLNVDEVGWCGWLSCASVHGTQSFTAITVGAMPSESVDDTYSYLGPAGTFTEVALRQVPAAAGKTWSPVNNVGEALDDVVTGRSVAAMIAIDESGQHRHEDRRCRRR